jgi:hypothetical protein
MNAIVAADVLKELESVRNQLNGTLRTIQLNCDCEEFKRFRAEIGKIMGAIFLDLVEPIYCEHPNLIPLALRQAKSGRAQKKKKAGPNQARSQDRRAKKWFKP